MAHVWEQIGPPLRPSEEDEAAYRQLIHEWVERHGCPRILLLGVTPEIHALPWPAGRAFIAVDHTRMMIDHVWPGGAGEVIQASWTDLPLRSGSRDLVLCDGGLHLLSYPVAQKRLVAQLGDVIAPGGRCIFRLFTPPEVQECPDSVLKDLLAGKIKNLNLLKLRLAMAMQPSAESGIPVCEVWQKLREIDSDWTRLAGRLGWSVDHLKAVDAYKTSPAKYHFAAFERVVDLFCGDGKFTYRGRSTPKYVLGERCPIVIFERPK